MTSRGNCARQTPELLGPGKGTKRSPSCICASEGCLRAEPERLGPGKCTQPRAGPRRFPAEHRRAGAVCAPRGRTGQAGQRYCVHTTVLFVCSIPPPHSATELVSLKNQQTEEVKQKELLRICKIFEEMRSPGKSSIIKMFLKNCLIVSIKI